MDQTCDSKYKTDTQSELQNIEAIQASALVKI
jgi:hypothetical protein